MASQGDAAPRRSSRAQRTSLGLFSVMGLGINTIVGSGIFRFPAELTADLGTASLLAFGACALLLLPVGLCFAEAGGMFEREGGAYVYAEAAFGREVGFAVGWAAWVATVLSLAAVAVAIPGQLAEISAPLGEPQTGRAVAAGLVVLFGGLNLWGRRPAAWTGNALVLVKLAALLGFVAIGAAHVEPANLSVPKAEAGALVGPSLLVAFFALSGFESSAVPAGEARRARRDVPISVLASLLGAAALYTLVQAVAIGLDPAIAHSERPLADAARRVLGGAGASAMSLAGTLSMLGLCAAMAFTAPRFLVALGEDGHLPRAVARWHPQLDTPHIAIALGTLLAVALTLTLDFRSLVDFTSVILIVQYLSTCLAVPVLRRTDPQRPRSWRVPFGPLLPLLGAVLMLAVLAQTGWQELALSALVMLVGFAARALRPRRQEAE